MKKIIAFIFAALFAAGVFGATETVDGVTYTYWISNGEATIENGPSAAISTSTSGALVIPSTLGGCPVTTIGSAAFSSCSLLTSVTIPEGVTIGSYAFYDCSSLTSVTIPEGVTTIGGDAFSGCSSLSSVTIPSSVTTIEYEAFGRCSSLTSVTIPESVMTIEGRAFSGCSSLTSVTIPDSVTTIGYRAFDGTPFVDNQPDGLVILGRVLYECKGTCPSEVTIPECVTTIGESAFSRCSKLTSVTIPSSVSTIGSYAFYDCSSLTSVTIPNSVTEIGGRAFAYCNSLTSVTISEGVTGIGNYAFSDCSSLTSVTIPSSVTTIGSYAFYDCRSLTSVTITEGVTTIGSYAFYDCSSLASVTIPDSVTTIGNRAFDGTPFVDNQPDGLVILGRVLHECKGTCPSEVTIPECVTTIGDYAFSGCSSLTAVTIPSSVTTIEVMAFSGCSSLTSVTIPDSVMTIEDWAFESCRSLESVTIPESVMTIGDWAFSLCRSQRTVYVDYGDTDRVKELMRGKGVDVDTLTFVEAAYKLVIDENGCVTGFEGELPSEVVIPEGVKTISSGAFRGCSSLASVTIPSSLTTIESDAFYNCSSLKEVHITDLAKWCAISFGSWRANPCYYAKHLYLNGEEIKDLVVPDSVKSIGRYAFEDCSSLTSVTIPNSVTTIGSSAFSGCSSLTSVTMPDSVASIGEYAFSSCGSLTSITIPDSVTSIGSSAFGYCSSLTSVTIPDSVTSIGNYAFDGCSSLKEVHITDLAKWCAIPFGSWRANPCYYAKHLYLNGEEIKDLVVPDSVTAIGDYAFFYCESLTSVTIPDSVTSIGSYAFYYCSSLTSVTIPDSVTTIGVEAFEGCWSLKTVYVDSEDANRVKELMRGKGVNVDNLTFVEIAYKLKIDENGCLTGYEGELPSELVVPEGVKVIGQEAFKDCTTITSIKIPNSVTSIGKRALYGCENLISVVLPTNKPNIGSQAFFGVPWYENAVVDYASGASQTVANSVTVTNVVVHYVVNSIQPEFAKPVSEDTGFVNVIAEVKGTSVAVPQTWAENYPEFTAKFGSDFTKALTAKSGKIAAGGREMLVWEDYVAGTDPTDPNDKFMASLTMVDGKPVISWTPELDAERAALRKYTTYGKAKLTDSEWIVVPAGQEEAYNFFKVTVEMK